MGLNSSPENGKLALGLADVLIRRGNPDGAAEALDSLKGSEAGSAWVEFYRARILSHRKHGWRRAGFSRGSGPTSLCTLRFPTKPTSC